MIVQRAVVVVCVVLEILLFNFAVFFTWTPVFVACVVCSCLALWPFFTLVLFGRRLEDRHAMLVFAKQAKTSEDEGEEPLMRSEVCDDCDSVVPLRGNHCVECKSCVMRFEFHSRWVDRCIGIFSTKIYLLAHFYFLVLATIVFVGLANSFSVNRFFSSVAALLVFSAAVSISLLQMFWSLKTLALLGFLVSKNRTYREWIEKDDANFDRGLASNWTMILGHDKRMFLLPIAPNFEVARREWFQKIRKRESVVVKPVQQSVSIQDTKAYLPKSTEKAPEWLSGKKCGFVIVKLYLQSPFY